MKKKITVLTTALYLLAICGNSIAAIDPYSFYPTKVYRPKGEIFRASKQIIDTNPLRPLVITDKSGNKTYMTSSGEVMVNVDNSGNKTFSFKGKNTHTRDASGKLTQTLQRQAGTDMVNVRNEFGETIAMKKEGLGGKTIAEYDADGNLVKSYMYDEYGKNIAWVVDELTQTKVKYDDRGRAIYDVNYEGAKIATYKYDREGKLESRTDVYGNVTTFDKYGNRLQTVAPDGDVIATYKYKKDANGYFQIEWIKDLAGNITKYEDGRQKDVYDINDTHIKTYKWQGSKLIFSEDLVTGMVVWYENGKPTYASYGDMMVNEWFYHEGKLAGIWQENKDSFQLYSHGQIDKEILFHEKPEIEEILAFYDAYGIEL